jgi:hypothetical protein
MDLQRTKPLAIINLQGEQFSITEHIMIYS